jgi:acetolactate synthase-1/2/3 large subunit
MNMKMTGGQSIVHSLIANGVDTVFGIPGIQTYPFFDALARQSDEIRVFSPMHEQTTAYMATGYAKVSGKAGVFSVVPGPGILNTGAAIVTAAAGNTPVLLITGQVPSSFVGQGRGHLHELKDQLATLRTLTKWTERIGDAKSAPHLVNRAFQMMTGGRPGPVALEMCWDTMMHSQEVEPLTACAVPANPQIDLDAVDEAAVLISKATKPMIMVGGGAQHAGDAVLELATLLCAPVTSFRSGRGIVSEDHDLGISSVAAWELWSDTDLLIGIGSRLEMPYMRWTGMGSYIRKPDSECKLIRIDIDPEEMSRLVPDVGVTADSDEGVRALISSVARHGFKSNIGTEHVSKAKALARHRIEKVQPQLAYLDIIRELLPRNGVFVKDLCQVGYASYFGFPVYQPGTYITSGYQGTLGFAFPTALGAKAANPDRPVIVAVGDGGFMFGIQELATAAQEKLGVVTIIFNNGGYGNIRRDQQRLFGGRLIGADLRTPDFVRLTESFGVQAERVNSPAGLKPVLARALESDAPCVIEVRIEKDSETNPWEFIVRTPESSARGPLRIT